MFKLFRNESGEDGIERKTIEIRCMRNSETFLWETRAMLCREKTSCELELANLNQSAASDRHVKGTLPWAILYMNESGEDGIDIEICCMKNK